MTISPEQIVVGAGTEYLYGVLISSWAGTGDTPWRTPATSG